MATLVERFWSKVNRDGPTMSHMSTPCWVWGGGKAVGYGYFSREGGRVVGAHRFSWELRYGPIPKGLSILHKCDNRPCVRPDHLYPGTHAQNARDCAERGPSRRGEENPRSELTDDLVITARLLRRHYGLPIAFLATAFGVTQATMWSALTWKTWKHLPFHL